MMAQIPHGMPCGHKAIKLQMTFHSDLRRKGTTPLDSGLRRNDESVFQHFSRSDLTTEELTLLKRIRHAFSACRNSSSGPLDGLQLVFAVRLLNSENRDRALKFL